MPVWFLVVLSNQLRLRAELVFLIPTTQANAENYEQNPENRISIVIKKQEKLLPGQEAL